MATAASVTARLAAPAQPALVVGGRHAVWMDADETVTHCSPADVRTRLAGGAKPLVCHAPLAAARLGLPSLAGYDLLELFAFVRPARFCVPTPQGLAEALILTPPTSPEESAALLPSAAAALLAELAASPGRGAGEAATYLGRAGWAWAPAVRAALGAVGREAAALAPWRGLPEWEDEAPPEAPGSWPVEPVEARARLIQLLSTVGPPRAEQLRYASVAAGAFAPRDQQGAPRIVLAEAGTGVGKTLAYLAPATVWAEKNGGPVWLSTFTRNLQRQLDRELDRAFPDYRLKARRVVLRKGRENMLCLLNFEDLARTAPAANTRTAVVLGLVARWILATRDGDAIGGDLPGWFAELAGPGVLRDLTDTRGECIYNACRHYRRCFIERAIRKARRADVVIANHALVMAQATRAADDASLPLRYVFDEGHHLFETADAAFAQVLSGQTMAELGRWLGGGKRPTGGRRRGLAERVDGLDADTAEIASAVRAVLATARVLPAAGWLQRLGQGTPLGTAEYFLARVRQQVLARNDDRDAAYAIETAVAPPVEELLETAVALAAELARLGQAIRALQDAFAATLDAEPATLTQDVRQRLESLRRSVERRAAMPVAAWQGMLRALPAAETPPEFVDWLAIDRHDGRETDIGYFRHWLDPMQPFAATVLDSAHGAMITSATLRDSSGDDDADWGAAEARTGVNYVSAPPALADIGSPFDYADRSRVYIVTDVDRRDAGAVAAAYETLFAAAGGGALGLFTAIERLRAVHRRIAGPLEAQGFTVLAQHVDALDAATLIEIFRADTDSCLLGTDALRDGVDVPGRALRLIVLDRVPWPRPTILHKARRKAFGELSFDDYLTRLRLKQAFGRLIRSTDDRGVFVILDRALPTRLLSAFPAGAPIFRLGLETVAAETRRHVAR